MKKVLHIALSSAFDEIKVDDPSLLQAARTITRWRISSRLILNVALVLDNILSRCSLVEKKTKKKKKGKQENPRYFY